MRGEPIDFPSAGGTCRGVLYRPSGANGATPVVVLAHGLGGTRLTQYDRRARRLAEGAVAVLDFDPRFIGTSPGTPRQRIHASDWLEDLRSAVAYARSRDDLDAQRLGLYGSSFGGGLALQLALEDPGVRAIALDVPMIDGLRATPSPMRSRPALVAAVARDVIARRRRRPPVLVPVFGGVVQNNIDGFWRAMGEIEGLEWVEPGRVVRHPELGEWRNEATALELLSSVRLRPARRAAAVQCSVLAHVAQDDRVVPFKPTRKALSRIPRGEIRVLDGGHFAPFHGSGFEATTSAQLDFFARELG